MQVYLTLQSLVFNPIPPMKSEFRPLRSGEVQWGLVKMSRPKKQVFFFVCVCVCLFFCHVWQFTIISYLHFLARIFPTLNQNFTNCIFLLVPENVRGLTAVRRSKELEVHWTEPERPNGVIIQYNLTLDGQLVFSGTDNNFTIRN